MMSISMDEVVVLAALGHKSLKKDEFATAVVNLYACPTKVDKARALVMIDEVERQKYVTKDKQQKYDITVSGHSAVLHAMPVIENLRAAMSTTHYRVFR